MQRLLILFISFVLFVLCRQVPYIDVKVVSTHVLPALVTLGSDQNLNVKYASIEAFGAVAQQFKNDIYDFILWLNSTRKSGALGNALDSHNRRRRKPQSELLHRTSAIYRSDQPGSTIFSFSNPTIFPTTVSSSSWFKHMVHPNSGQFPQSRPLHVLENGLDGSSESGSHHNLSFRALCKRTYVKLGYCNSG